MQESGAVDRVKLNFENNKGTERKSSCMVLKASRRNSRGYSGHEITEEMHMFQDRVEHWSKVIGQSRLED